MILGESEGVKTTPNPQRSRGQSVRFAHLGLELGLGLGLGLGLVSYRGRDEGYGGGSH